MQFFIYYVGWPFALGIGVVCANLLNLWWSWLLLGIWIFHWGIGSMAKERIQYERTNLKELIKERTATGNLSSVEPLLMILGPLVVLFLAVQTGVSVTRLITEKYMDMNGHPEVSEVREDVRDY